MSGPVPSPSMYGTTGWSGTVSFPWLILIAWPLAGTVTSLNVGMRRVSRIRESLRGYGKAAGRSKPEAIPSVRRHGLRGRVRQHRRFTDENARTGTFGDRGIGGGLRGVGDR